MTKPITATAVLMLQDEGELNVGDPVAAYLPEFAHLKTPSIRRIFSTHDGNNQDRGSDPLLCLHAYLVARALYHAAMSTILEADEAGTLHLPPSLLPQPGPHQRYRVATENGQLIVAEASPGTTKPWMELAGCFKDEAEELRRIDQIIADEFERVDPEDWR